MRDGARLLGQLAELVLAAAAEAPHRPVEALLAEALRRLTVPRRCTVLWHRRLSTPASPTAADLHLLTGADCTDLRQPAVLLPAPLSAPAWLPPLRFPRDRHFDRSVLVLPAPAADPAPWLRASLGLRTDPHIHSVALGIDPDDSPAGRARVAEVAAALRLHHSQLRHLFSILSALQITAATRHREELRRDVEALLATTPPDPLAALPAATALLRRLTLEQLHPWGPDTIGTLAEPLVTWAVHGVLGDGITPHHVVAPAPRAHLSGFCEAVGHLRQVLAAPGRARHRLLALEQTLHAPLMPPPATAPPRALLPCWTGMHTLAAVLCRSGRPPPPTAEAAWIRLAAESRRGLARLLGHPRARRGGTPAQVRTWMSLWLALQLLLPPADQADAPDLFSRVTLSAARWRLRAALALVVQEGLRALCLRHRSGDRGPHAGLTAALRLLVEHHARLAAHLPAGLDLGGHLSLLAGEDLAVGGAGHLQHVLDLYMAGHLLCSLELPADPPERLGDRLASRSGMRPGAHEQRTLRAALSLAALHHDVGMLLSHAPSSGRAARLTGEQALREAFQDIAAQSGQAGMALVEQARAALLAAGCLDSASEPGLLRWIEDQRQRGAPDHALLGAWYLLRVCHRIEGLAPEVVRAATRATLLHAALGERLDPDLDPAAVLLVLCDEILDWEPATAHEAPPPEEAEDALYAPAMAPDPRRSRAAHLQVVGLVPRVDVAGRLCLGLDQAAPLVLAVGLQPPGVAAPPALRTWLRMAQNLGRIRPAQGGWGPEVRLRARIPPRIQQAAGSSHALLDRTLQYGRDLPAALRTHLPGWLLQQPVQGTDSDEQEQFCITPGGRIMLPEGRRLDFPVLAAAMLAVVRDLERDAGAHGQVLSAYIDGV